MEALSAVMPSGLLITWMRGRQIYTTEFLNLLQLGFLQMAFPRILKI